MKNSISIVLILFFSIPAFSQSLVLKGRIIALPGNLKAFSMGIGIEKMMGKRLSLQGLVNRHGWDMRETDGGAAFTNAVVAEGRYYFGKEKSDAHRKPAFLGLFFEHSWTKLKAGGEQDDDYVYLGGTRKAFSPGLLIGKEAWLSNKWLLDFYVGGKYQFGTESKDYRNFQVPETKRRNFQKMAIRVGLNVGFRF